MPSAKRADLALKARTSFEHSGDARPDRHRDGCLNGEDGEQVRQKLAPRPDLKDADYQEGDREGCGEKQCVTECRVKVRRLGVEPLIEEAGGELLKA